MKLKDYTVEEIEGGDGRQAWRLTSDIDDVSVWVTSIVSADSLLSADVDIRDTIDDAVDAVIERVLEAGGNVVFTPPGSLRANERIVLLPRDLSSA